MACPTRFRQRFSPVSTARKIGRLCIPAKIAKQTTPEASTTGRSWMANWNAEPVSPETHASVVSAAAQTWRRPPLIRSRALRWMVCAGALTYLTFALGSLEVSWLRLYQGLERGWRFIEGFLLPDFVSRWSDIMIGMQESLTMTVTSTVIGVLISVPVGIGAARNLASQPVYLLCRGVIALARSFQEIIVAILLSRCSASVP